MRERKIDERRNTEFQVVLIPDHEAPREGQISQFWSTDR